MFSPLPTPPVTHSCPFSVFLSFFSHTMVSKPKKKTKKQNKTTDKIVKMKQKAHKQKIEFILFWQSTPEYGT